ncbi:Uncharacterized protein HZ326_31354, partial [Fusarium oxysporum f. sp. albedinis]
MRSSLGPEVKNSRSFSERNYMVQSLKRVICNVFDKYANYTTGKNSVLETWVIEHRIRCSISRPYACLSMEKH